MKQISRDGLEAPKVVDRSMFQAELDALRVREKAHTREGDAIAAARRRLPAGRCPSPTIPACMEMSYIPLRIRRRNARQKKITLDKHSSFTDLTQRPA